MRPLEKTEILAYGLLVGLSVWILTLTQVADYDIWWHVAKGEYLLEHGEILERDPYSHTAPGGADVDTSWLFDLGVAQAVRHVGIDATPYLGATIAALAFVTLYLAGCIAGVSAAAMATGILATTPMLRFYLVLRPHLVSFACLAFLVFLLCAHDRWKRTGMLVAAVPLIWLWRQIHPSYPLGVVVLGTYLVFPQVLRSPATGGTPAEGSLPLFTRAAILAGAAVCFVLPPLGWKGTLWIVETLRLLQGHGGLVTEWLPPSLFPGQFGQFWIYTVLGCAGLLLSARARTPFSVAVFGLSCLMALSGIRHICGFAILTLIPVSAAWSEILGRIGRHLGSGQRVLRTLLVVAACAFCVMAGIHGEYPPFGVGIAENAFPSGAARFIERVGLRGKMYNTHRLGGYLLWRLGEGGKADGRKVFWDGRLLQYLTLFDETRAATASADPNRALDELLAKYGVDYAVMDYRDEHPIARRLRERPDWALVYWDDSSVVLVQRDGPGRALLPLEWRAVRPWDRSLRFLDAAGPEAAQVRVELQQKLAEDPRCSRAMAMLGLLMLREDHAAGAAGQLGRFLKERKESEWVRLVWAQALIAAGKPAEALAALEPLAWTSRSKAAVRELQAEARRRLDGGDPK